MALPEAANQRWSLDCVSDALSNGRRFRVLAVVDDFTRECLGLVADTSLSGLRVGRELDRIVEWRGCRPAMIVSDNGTKLTSHAMLRWQEKQSVLWHYIAELTPQRLHCKLGFELSWITLRLPVIRSVLCRRTKLNQLSEKAGPPQSPAARALSGRPSQSW